MPKGYMKRFWKHFQITHILSLLPHHSLSSIQPLLLYTGWEVRKPFFAHGVIQATALREVWPISVASDERFKKIVLSKKLCAFTDSYYGRDNSFCFAYQSTSGVLFEIMVIVVTVVIPSFKIISNFSRTNRATDTIRRV